MMSYNIVAKEGFKLYTKALNSSYNIPKFKEQFKFKTQCDLKLVRDQVYNCDET